MSDLVMRPLRPDEVRSFAGLTHYAFRGRPAEAREAELEPRGIRPERDILVAEVDGEIVSQVLIHDFAIWIDGVRFPNGGLAAVATAPEQTGRGYASALLRHTLAWMRQELGQSLCTLYPTVLPLYAKLGWALAEDSYRYSGPPSAFRPSPRLPIDPGGRIIRKPAEPGDLESLEAIYRAFAQPRTGYLDRPRWVWDEILQNKQTGQPRWLAIWNGSAGQPGGYLIYDREDLPEQALAVHDLAALRPEAWHDLLTFLAAHHLWHKVVWPTGRDLPIRAMVANPQALTVDVPINRHYMLRIVDLPAAIGRKAALDTAPVPPAVLEVRDADAPWNDGLWKIAKRESERGLGWTCERTTQMPQAKLEIATLSALFGGFLDPRQALDSGLLTADPAIHSTLTAFAATAYPPTSWDHF